MNVKKAPGSHTWSFFAGEKGGKHTPAYSIRAPCSLFITSHFVHIFLKQTGFIIKERRNEKGNFIFSNKGRDENNQFILKICRSTVIEGLRAVGYFLKTLFKLE